MVDRGLAIRSPPKRAPQRRAQITWQNPTEPLTLVPRGSVFRRYCLCVSTDMCVPIPPQGSPVPIDAPVKKMLQPMWKVSLSAQEFCRFWEEDWPQLRALRIQALRGCLATLHSVDSAAIALLKDKLYEAQQSFSAIKEARDHDHAIVHICREDALREAALLGHADRKILNSMAHIANYPTQGLSSRSSGHTSAHTDPDALEQHILSLYKQLFFKAFHLRVIYTQNMLRLSGAVILDNDTYMLLRGTLLTWHKLLCYKRCLIHIDNLVSSVLDMFAKRGYLHQWLSALRTRVAVQKEKVLRRLLYNSIGASNTSYPEPSILSSPSIMQQEPSRTIICRLSESYLTHLYNIFIAVGTPLTPQSRLVLSLTDLSIVIGLISKLSRIRRKVCVVFNPSDTKRTHEMRPSFIALSEVLQSAHTRTALETFGTLYYNNFLVRKMFSRLRDSFYLRTLHNLAIIYSTYAEKSHIIRTLSIGLSVQRQCVLIARTRFLLRVSFVHLCRAYAEASAFKNNHADQFYRDLLISIAWRSISSLAKRYAELTSQATDILTQSILRLERSVFESFKLAYKCNVFLGQHINNRCNFRYRRLFWTMHKLTLQRRALRKVMREISFPRYKRLIQLESYHASQTYQHDICHACIHHWREVSLHNQKALALHQLAIRADTFYSQKLLCFVMRLLLLKTKQKQESRLFFYRRQICLVKMAFRQWNIRLCQHRRVVNLGATLKEIMDKYIVRFTNAIVTELFHQWRIQTKSQYSHTSMLQRQAFQALCTASVSIRYLHVSSKQYQQSLMRRAYSTLIVLYQYQRLLTKLDKRYEHTLKQVGFSSLRTSYRLIIKDTERADQFYQHCLLIRTCKVLEYVAVRSRVYAYAYTIGIRYIKFFYLRRWKLSLHASREAVYLEKRADSFYKGLLERWADRALCGCGAKTDIPVSCLVSHTNKELLETGLLGSIVLSSKVLKAHLLYENKLLLVVFDEWRYAVIRRQRLISMRGPI
ncbi:Hypothetical protein GLP15_3715 [Giardia lamblia P15]|uniref:Uncharacterized protein n=1 Tax=Giardia intestinalis (strain P15) TaxID=658858 RepID=E1F5U8_GIAIA|nr:Hypothetical protein GLP15_3715 [Giardia lamblia P15]